KWDDLVKKADEQRAQRGQGGNGGGQNGGGRGGRGGGGGPQDPASVNKRLYDRAEKELTLTTEEKPNVLELVKKLLDARTAQQTGRDQRNKELATFMKDKGATDAERAEIVTKL